jgi:putative transposase
MKTRSVNIELTPRQRAVLEPLANAKTAPQQLVERARIILMSADARENQEQANKLGVDRQRVRRWRWRWARASTKLARAEAAGATDKDFEKLVLGVLADKLRPGVPPKFTPEQVAAIIALACEPPADSGLPISHWTPPELAREAIKRGIVEAISARQVDRFLARRTSVRTRASTG